MYFPHGFELLMCDPVYYQDLIVTHNKVLEKHEFTKNLYTDLFWNSILFEKSSAPSYKPRRKLISHAFYANKLKEMSGMIFDEIHERLKLWETTYPTGELDLVAELAQIVGKIIVAASIGTEYSNQELPYKNKATGRNEMMNIGNFLNKTLGDAAIRD